MLKGILQRPTELQLTFQIQQGLLILFSSCNDTPQHLINRDPELSDQRRDPTLCDCKAVACEFFPSPAPLLPKEGFAQETRF